jgi:hypothetical protein
MRKTWSVLTAVALVLGWSGAVRAEEKDESRAIIAKAIDALGGADKLEKLKAATFTEKGTYYGMGEGLPYTGKYAVQFPGQFRMEIEGAFVFVLDGDKGWNKSGGETKEMDKKQLGVHRHNHRAGWIASLSPLRDKAFTLTAIEGVTVDGKPTVGVKVTRKDYPEVKLYFDKATNLLVKSEFKTQAEDQEFKDVTMETFYGNYKEKDGAKVPTKLLMTRDGKKYVEAEVLEFKAVGKLDDKVFAKP